MSPPTCRAVAALLGATEKPLMRCAHSFATKVTRDELKSERFSPPSSEEATKARKEGALELRSPGEMDPLTPASWTQITFGELGRALRISGILSEIFPLTLMERSEMLWEGKVFSLRGRDWRPMVEGCGELPARSSLVSVPPVAVRGGHRGAWAGNRMGDQELFCKWLGG